MVDPLSESYSSWSSYNYVLNNPIRLVDPDGMRVDDIIELDKSGYVVNVIEQEGDNVFRDYETKEEYSIHDASGADQLLLSDSFVEGERLFTPISNNEMDRMINNAGMEAGDQMKNGTVLQHLNTTRRLSYDETKADFPFVLLHRYDLKVDVEETRTRVFNDVTGTMFKFEDGSTLYNPSDAGQFLWGSWMNKNGYKLWEAKGGAHLNEIFSGFDSNADQKAIENGFKY